MPGRRYHVLPAAFTRSGSHVNDRSRSPPRVGIAQGADLGAVVTHLVERAGDEVRGRASGTRRAADAQAASRRLRGVRVPGGRHFELVVVGPLDRPAESLPAVAQRA